MAELIVAGKCKLKGNTKSLDGHDGDGADGRANGKVNEGILLSVGGCNLVNHKDGKGDDGNGVEQKACVRVSTGISVAAWRPHTWLNGVMQNLIDSLNFLIWRSMQNNDDGANEANGTSKLAQNTKLFFQKV